MTMPQRPLYLNGTIDSSGPIAELMTRPVVKVSTSTKISEVVALLRQFEIHHIPVVDDKDHLQGMISSNDLTRYERWDRQAGTISNDASNALSQLTAGELMSSNAVSIHQDKTLLDVAGLMNAHRFHCLPVVDDLERLVGILTAHDLIRLAYPGS